MAHAQKPDFVFRRNGRVHLNRPGRQFSRLLAAEVCASAVVMLDTPCFEVVWRVLATHSIRQFPLRFPSRASPCTITFHLEYRTFSTLSHDGTISVQNFPGYAVEQLVLALCYKPKGRGFNFQWLSPSGHREALELTKPLTEMSTRGYLVGVKASGA